uniref:Major facilitator superfamily (MFS) profile domain-containing protein n=1 Tax=Favella ehrenbergii TaxID=182087 RepID=A0A7S3MI29_9SPIT|mmetsp:Transcript_12489/g.15975  ORF Transcript_12489/g.15975 Transcript_12489/m.15975 type:complete len:204 (+) Transcript_12489:1011-1622(+)
MLFSNYFGTFFMYAYKTYGENKGSHPPISDSVLTWAASIGAGLVNGCTRLILGSLLDKHGFKKLFAILMFCQLVVSLVCYHAVYWPWLYFLCILLNYMSLGGMFTIFPVCVQNVFGLESGPQIYVWILLGSFVASVLNTLSTIYLLPSVGFQALFYFGSVAQVITLLILHCFEEKLDVERLARFNALKSDGQIEVKQKSGDEH